MEFFLNLQVTLAYQAYLNLREFYQGNFKQVQPNLHRLHFRHHHLKLQGWFRKEWLYSLKDNQFQSLDEDYKY